MDIQSIRPKTKDLNVLHPGTGQETGFILELVYPGHPRMIAAETQHGKRIRKHNGDMDIAAQRKLLIAMNAAAVENWRFENGATLGGDTPAFDRNRLTELLEDPDFQWLREQINAAYEERADFFPASPAKSKASAKS